MITYNLPKKSNRASGFFCIVFTPNAHTIETITK